MSGHSRTASRLSQRQLLMKLVRLLRLNRLRPRPSAVMMMMRAKLPRRIRRAVSVFQVKLGIGPKPADLLTADLLPDLLTC